MGFKTTNYEVAELGITLPTAYAQIETLTTDINGEVYATFAIQQNREDIVTKTILEHKTFMCKIDKSQPLYEQLYIAAKPELFPNWENDIVDETDVIEETGETE